jgi:hypothetical protein
MSVSRPHMRPGRPPPMRRSSANAPQRAGASQWTAAMSAPVEEVGDSRSQRPHPSASVAGKRCAAHRRTRRNAQAHRDGMWRTPA